MADSDFIQKDLGLVTAYGYALAGGYQGTEEQFKQDFATLIDGQYTALRNKPKINGVELVGDKTSEDLHINTGGGETAVTWVRASNGQEMGISFENGAYNGYNLIGNEGKSIDISTISGVLKFANGVLYDFDEGGGGVGLHFERADIKNGWTYDSTQCTLNNAFIYYADIGGGSYLCSIHLNGLILSNWTFVPEYTYRLLRPKTLSSIPYSLIHGYYDVQHVITGAGEWVGSVLQMYDGEVSLIPKETFSASIGYSITTGLYLAKP